MAEYPNAVPSIAQVFNPTDDVDWVEAEVFYPIRDELIAALTELGALPKGTSASVKERIKGIKSESDANADVIVVKGSSVGIGTASPSRLLTLYNNSGSTTTGQFLVEQDGAGDALINIGLKGGRHYAIGVDNSDGDKLKIGQASTGPAGVISNTTLTIDTSRNVGIGTTNPKSRLHVVGLPIYANNAAAIIGGLTAGAFYRTGADPDPVCVVH